MRALLKAVVCLTLLVFVTACDTERLNKLEKENADLKARVDQQNDVVSLGKQEKCSNAAANWVRANFRPGDRSMMMFDYTNHFNQKQNKCLVLVEYQYQGSKSGRVTDNRGVWNVFENTLLANYSAPYPEPGEAWTGACDVGGATCHSSDEFDNLIHPLMND